MTLEQDALTSSLEAVKEKEEMEEENKGEDLSSAITVSELQGV